MTTRRAGAKPAEGVRWESDGGGEYAVETVERPARGTEITLHLREGQDDLLDGTRLRAIIRRYSDHIVQPILMPKEDWQDGKAVKAAESETVNQASALWARPEGRHLRGRLQGVLQARRPRFRRPARLDARARRGQDGVHAPPLRPRGRALRPVGPQRPPRREALRAPRLHHGRRRAAAAGVPALRARHRRFRGPPAQRLARDPAGVEGHRGHPRRLHAQGALASSRAWPPDEKEKYAALLGGLRPRPQGRASARTTPTRRRSRGSCASPRPTPTPRTRPSRSPTTSRA